MADSRAVVIADPDAEHRKRIVAVIGEVATTLEAEMPVHEAVDGNGAEELIDEVQPELVVTEVLLDGQSGLQLLRKFKGAEDTRVPTWVVVSHMNREADKYWALRNGADAYVMRPYEDEALKARIIKLLKGEGDPEKFT